MGRKHFPLAINLSALQSAEEGTCRRKRQSFTHYILTHFFRTEEAFIIQGILRFFFFFCCSFFLNLPTCSCAAVTRKLSNICCNEWFHLSTSFFFYSTRFDTRRKLFVAKCAFKKDVFLSSLVAPILNVIK